MADIKLGFSVVTPTNRTRCIDNLISNYLRQTFSNKELIIVINNDEINVSDFDRYVKEDSTIKVYKLPQDISLGECLNFGIEKSSYSWIAKFDDDDYYSMNYLLQASNILKLNEYDIVGKSSVYYYFEEFNELCLLTKDENEQTDWIAGATICFKKEVFDTIKFVDKKHEDYYFLNDANNNGLKIFTTSKYNFLVFRSQNLDNHTWQIKSKELRDICQLIKKDISLEESYIEISR